MGAPFLKRHFSLPPNVGSRNFLGGYLMSNTRAVFEYFFFKASRGFFLPWLLFSNKEKSPSFLVVGGVVQTK
jgi:hypothetical protein